MLEPTTRQTDFPDSRSFPGLIAHRLVSAALTIALASVVSFSIGPIITGMYGVGVRIVIAS